MTEPLPEHLDDETTDPDDRLTADESDWPDEWVAHEWLAGP